MDTGLETKVAFGDVMQAFEAFKEANDERLAQIEARMSADVVTAEKVDRINRAVDEAKARALFQQWVNSRAHRKVMLNRSFRFVSTGVIARGNSIWAVQIFFGAPRKKGLFQ